MKTVENIYFGDILLSIIIRDEYTHDGIEFFTPDTFSQQLGYMKREKGYSIPPHIHNIVHRDVTLTQEVLIIKSGKVRVDFYTKEKDYIESRIVKEGDIILLADGGHGFEMIEDSEILEIKQGPYAGENDKVRFESVDSNKTNIRE